MKIRLLCVAVIIGAMLSAWSLSELDSPSALDAPSALEQDSNASLMTQIGKISCYYDDLAEEVRDLEGDFWGIFQNAHYTYVLEPESKLDPIGDLELTQEVLTNGLIEALKNELSEVPEEGCDYALLTGRIGFLYTCALC